ncbi:C-C motif chemokine 24-like [Toxotes jaculatrix]|uniref:C-C motif chemokine 24-like n=1 Tax=Toxotes jaculatrix TaxID=941984 RepID=UPI001B3ADF7A|nr:C-C motif chemokine 24-like [Toxotes jaculatrix]
MPFSISCKLFLCLTLLLLFPSQGQPEPALLKRPNVHQLIPSCCMTASLARIKQTVIACYEQREGFFANCKIHAYIFVTKRNQKYCVDPTASWLPERLERLKKRGIRCQSL